MSIVHERTIERIRETLPAGLGVIEGSLPVVAFGDFLATTLRAATVALNPSSSEFWGSPGKWLPASKTRLASRNSLGLAPDAPLTDEHVGEILRMSNHYFQGNPLTRWFNPLNDVLRDACDADYWQGTACHLDLVQWATHPLQGKLGDRWLPLVQRDRDFLRWQIDQTPAQLLVLNGVGVVRELERTGVITELEVREFQFHLPSGRAWPLKVYRAEAQGKRVVGWNQVIARAPTWPIGARERLIDELRGLMA